MVDILDTAPSYRRLPFSFANRFKMVLEIEHPERPPVLYYVEPLNAQALVEVRRVLKQTFVPQAIAAEAFEKTDRSVPTRLVRSASADGGHWLG